MLFFDLDLDGQLRLPVIEETTATSHAWKTDDYPSSPLAGPTPMLTLVATDGVNATVVDSRPFTLPNRAPQVVVLSPRNQSQYKPSEGVELEGSFYDPEDGLNLNPQLTWTSNLQGALGTGKRIVAPNLSTGTHRITVTGADKNNNRGSATGAVIVRAENIANIEATPAGLDFGSVAMGKMFDAALMVRNSGNAPLTINAVASSNPQFSATSPARPFTVAPRSQQSLIVRFAPTAAGAQTGALTIASNAANASSLAVPLTGKTAGALASVSAASFSGQSLAAESIVATFGAGLATGVAVASATPLPTTLSGTTVRVLDSAGVERLAPLFFVAPEQINFLIPVGTAAGTGAITITSGAGVVSIGAATIASVAPGVFTANASGQGVPAAIIIRVANNSAQTIEPVSRYDTATQRFVATPIEFTPDISAIALALFGAGWRFRSAQTGATVSIGGVNAPVLYVGAQGSLTGLDQLNVELPRSLAGRGEVDVVVTVDSKVANTVRINIK